MARHESRKAPDRGGMAFSRNLMVLGAVILIVGGYAAIRGAITLTWPRAPATIVSAQQLRQAYDYGMQNSVAAAEMSDRHPVNSTAEVAYDPRDPAVAYLEPGPSSFSRVLVGIGAAMALIGLWVRRMAARGLGSMSN